MKFQKGDLVRHKDDILLITAFGLHVSTFTNKYNVYTFINLTTIHPNLKNNTFTAQYLDKMAEKIG